MIRSMTGFGEARIDEDDHAYHVELRSVNHRYFKVHMRLPEEFSFLETRLEQVLRRHLTRGSVTLRLSVRDLSAEAAQDLNAAAVRAYVERLRQAAGDQADLTIDLATLALLPGVCQPHEMDDARRQRCAAIIERLTDQAAGRLVEMRRAEGAALAEDLRRHVEQVRTLTAEIRALAPRMVEQYRDRLAARVQELIADSGAKLADEDLLREVAIFAERSDISEELSRLDSHVEQFLAAMGSGEPAGRKLDFIAQEMLREANTIGSKSADAGISRRVVELKGAIDRIKEQVQNVE